MFLVSPCSEVFLCAGISPGTAFPSLMPSVTEVLSSCFLRSTGCRDPGPRSDWLLLCGHVLEAEVAEQKTCHSLFCSSTSPSSVVFYCSCSKLSFVFFCFPGLVKQRKSDSVAWLVVHSAYCQLGCCFLHIVREDVLETSILTGVK